MHSNKTSQQIVVEGEPVTCQYRHVHKLVMWCSCSHLRGKNVVEERLNEEQNRVARLNLPRQNAN